MKVKELLAEVAEVSRETSEKALAGMDEVVAKAVANEMAKGKMGGAVVVSGREEGQLRAGAFFKALAGGDMVKVKALSEGVDASGGFLVHQEFSTEVVRLVGEYGVARKVCRVIPMGSDQKNIDALTGTVTAYIVGEAAAITASTPTFGRAVLAAKKFAAIVHSSNELIDDSASDQEVFAFMAELMAEQFAKLEDEQVLMGSGVGNNMLGAMNLVGASSVVMPATKVSFADVDFDDLLDMQDAVPVGARAKGVYVMHSDIYSYLRKKKDVNNDYIFEKPGDVKVGNAMLWGKIVYFSDVLPAAVNSAVSTKFVIFGDFSKYVLGERKSLSLTTLTEGIVGGINLGETDGQALRGVRRVAGTAVVDGAFAVLETAAV